MVETGRENAGVTDAGAGAGALGVAVALRQGAFLPAAFLRAGFRGGVLFLGVFLRAVFFDG